MLNAAVLSQAPDAAGASYRSFDEVFEALARLAHDERLVMVIDEYPYLAESHPEISSLLQEKIDHSFSSSSKLMLILCGSSLSFMEERVMGYESPLYGRRTAQFKIEPFDFFTTLDAWPGMALEDAAVCYGMTDGVPAYVEKIDPTATLEENITRQFLDPAVYLFEEPGNLLLQECRNPGQYDAIVQAIAQDRTKVSEIASATGIAASNTKVYLDKLISLGIVERELPLNENGATSRWGRTYSIRLCISARCSPVPSASTSFSPCATLPKADEMLQSSVATPSSTRSRTCALVANDNQHLSCAFDALDTLFRKRTVPVMTLFRNGDRLISTLFQKVRGLCCSRP